MKNEGGQVLPLGPILSCFPLNFLVFFLKLIEAEPALNFRNRARTGAKDVQSQLALLCKAVSVKHTNQHSY